VRDTHELKTTITVGPVNCVDQRDRSTNWQAIAISYRCLVLAGERPLHLRQQRAREPLARDQEGYGNALTPEVASRLRTSNSQSSNLLESR
jgi:hypothetical protein